MNENMKLDLITLLEASSWENIQTTGLLELNFSFILPFTGVCRFNKQNVRNVPQVIEQETTVPQVRDRKSAELAFLGF